MPTWLVAEGALWTLETLSRMKNGARMDELRALAPVQIDGTLLDRMQAKLWVRRDGPYVAQRRYRIAPLGHDALNYGRAERASRK